MIIYILASCEDTFGPKVIRDALFTGVREIRKYTNAPIAFGFSDTLWVLKAESDADVVLPKPPFEHEDGTEVTAADISRNFRQRIGDEDWPAGVGDVAEIRVDYIMGIMINAGIWEDR